MYQFEHKTFVSKNSKNVQPSTAVYFNKIGNKAEELLACLIAIDCTLFATSDNIEDIKNGWKAQGLKIPDDSHAIKAIVMNYEVKIFSRASAKIIEWGKIFNFS